LNEDIFEPSGQVSRPLHGEQEERSARTSDRPTALEVVRQRPESILRILPRKSVYRVLVAVLGFLVASLVVPAATKQWSDRPQELSLKRDIITNITESSTDAILISECIVSLCLPEQVALRGNPEDRSRISDADAAGQRTLENNNRSWAKTGAVVHALLEAYFPDGQVDTQWDGFSRAIASYLRLASSECQEARDRDMAVLQGYLSNVEPAVWDDLLRDLNSTCGNTPYHFMVAYYTVGDELLKKRDYITRKIMEENPLGYSGGLGDFVRDLYPF
jgi:hypothetical protein